MCRRTLSLTVVLMLGHAAPAVWAGGTFANDAIYGVGSSTRSVAIGDLDGADDGDLIEAAGLSADSSEADQRSSPAMAFSTSDPTRQAAANPADWTENWESYPDSSCMHGLGGWKGWDNSPTWNACLQEAISRSTNSAIDSVADADLIHQYSGHDSGVWDLFAYQYVPSGLNAPNGQYFIVQKEYNDGGPYQWSIQMWVATDGTVHCDCGVADNGTPGVMWIPDAWNEIHAVIDLDNDWVELFYNGTLLGAYQWTTGVFGTDPASCPASGCIGAIDLFAFSGSSVYYDDLEITGQSSCGSCPTDVNGDNITGPFDLASLLGAWGPTAAGNCLDANGDLVIGPFDLATLLGAWGPCP